MSLTLPAQEDRARRLARARRLSLDFLVVRLILVDPSSREDRQAQDWNWVGR
jgi:hypothetical protein